MPNNTEMRREILKTYKRLLASAEPSDLDRETGRFREDPDHTLVNLHRHLHSHHNAVDPKDKDETREKVIALLTTHTGFDRTKFTESDLKDFVTSLAEIVSLHSNLAAAPYNPPSTNSLAY